MITNEKCNHYFICCCQQNETHLGIHVKPSILLSDCKDIWNSRQIFVKILKYQENLSSGSRADACGQANRRDKINRHFSLFMRTRLKTVKTQFELSVKYIMLSVRNYHSVPCRWLCAKCHGIMRADKFINFVHSLLSILDDLCC